MKRSYIVVARACPPGLHPDLRPALRGGSSQTGGRGQSLTSRPARLHWLTCSKCAPCPAAPSRTGLTPLAQRREGKVLTTAVAAGDPITAYVAGESTAALLASRPNTRRSTVTAHLGPGGPRPQGWPAGVLRPGGPCRRSRHRADPGRYPARTAAVRDQSPSLGSAGCRFKRRASPRHPCRPPPSPSRRSRRPHAVVIGGLKGAGRCRQSFRYEESSTRQAAATLHPAHCRHPAAGEQRHPARSPGHAGRRSRARGSSPAARLNCWRS